VRRVPASLTVPWRKTSGPYLSATYATRLGAAAGSTFAIDPKSEARGAGRIQAQHRRQVEGLLHRAGQGLGPGAHVAGLQRRLEGRGLRPLPVGDLRHATRRRGR
jgi:hypothetical protein